MLIKAYKQIHVAYNAALDYFSNKDDSNWIIPVVVGISNDLRLIAGLVCKIIVRDMATGDIEHF